MEAALAMGNLHIPNVTGAGDKDTNGRAICYTEHWRRPCLPRIELIRLFAGPVPCHYHIGAVLGLMGLSLSQHQLHGAKKGFIWVVWKRACYENVCIQSLDTQVTFTHRSPWGDTHLSAWSWQRLTKAWSKPETAYCLGWGIFNLKVFPSRSSMVSQGKCQSFPATLLLWHVQARSRFLQPLCSPVANVLPPTLGVPARQGDTGTAAQAHGFSSTECWQGHWECPGHPSGGGFSWLINSQTIQNLRDMSAVLNWVSCTHFQVLIKPREFHKADWQAASHCR